MTYVSMYLCIYVSMHLYIYIFIYPCGYTSINSCIAPSTEDLAELSVGESGEHLEAWPEMGIK